MESDGQFGEKHAHKQPAGGHFVASVHVLVHTDCWCSSLALSPDVSFTLWRLLKNTCIAVPSRWTWTTWAELDYQKSKSWEKSIRRAKNRALVCGYYLWNHFFPVASPVNLFWHFCTPKQLKSDSQWFVLLTWTDWYPLSLTDFVLCYGWASVQYIQSTTGPSCLGPAIPLDGSSGALVTYIMWDRKLAAAVMASTAATRAATGAARVVKPIFSRDLDEAKRRVRELYRAWYREVPNTGMCVLPRSR